MTNARQSLRAPFVKTGYEDKIVCSPEHDGQGGPTLHAT
jgi:hypothetical protein